MILSLRLSQSVLRVRLIRAAAAGLVLGATPSNARAQVSVDALEMAFALSAPVAAVAPQEFHVTNDGAARTQVTINVQDWDRSETGENRYAPLGTLSQSCRAHVKVFPTVVQLEAGATASVRVWLDDVAAVPRGCYTILFVETPKPPPSSLHGGLRYSMRYGVKVYVEPQVQPTAELFAATVSSLSGSSVMSLELGYRNVGSRQTIAKGVVEVRRPNNTVATTIPIAEFYTLPGATRRLSAAIPSLPRGTYVLLAMIDFGGAEIAAAQVQAEIR